MIRLSAITSLAACALSLAAVDAVTISLNFSGNVAEGAMAATDTAGVVPASHWNNLVENSGNDNTGTALMDSTGAATGVSVSWISIGPWNMEDLAAATGDTRMFKGYLDNFGDPRTLTLSGMNAASTYKIYLYADGDDDGNTRIGFYTIGDVTTGIVDAARQFDGNYVEVAPNDTAEGNYTVFTVTGSTHYDLVFYGGAASDGVLRAPLNGMQIVEVVATGTPPKLDIAVSSGNAVLNWPAGTGLALYQTTDLQTWSKVTGSETLTSYTAPLSSAPKKFFRLSTP